MVTVKINKPEDISKLKLNKNSILFFTMKTCPYCIAMGDEWKKAKRLNTKQTIYEIQANCVSHLPNKIKKIVYAFPTIAKYNGTKFIMFEGNRTKDSFSSFMKDV